MFSSCGPLQKQKLPSAASERPPHGVPLSEVPGLALHTIDATVLSLLDLLKPVAHTVDGDCRPTVVPVGTLKYGTQVPAAGTVHTPAPRVTHHTGLQRWRGGGRHLTANPSLRLSCTRFPARSRLPDHQ